jgi:peptidyl-prolyl cis-trans isomerase C
MFLRNPPMKATRTASRHALALALTTLLAVGTAQAQNIAVVNGKPVPKARVETLIQQAEKAGQKVSPEMQQQARDQVVLREIFVQEAERRGIQASADYRAQMELARQSILIRQLFDDFRPRTRSPTKPPRSSTTSSRPRPPAPSTAPPHPGREGRRGQGLIKQIKAGAKFDELAKKHSKDPGSAPTAATSTSPSPTPTCPSSARP